MANKNEALKKITNALFLPEAEAQNMLTAYQLERKNRLMFCVSKIMSNPMTPDREIVEFLMGGCGGNCTAISQTQAYRDLSSLIQIVGNVKNASKAWIRYTIAEATKETYAIAKEKGDSKGMNGAVANLGKYTRADKNDDAFNFDDMLPPVFEPTDDVTVLGDIEVIPNLEKRRQELRALLKNPNTTNITDAEIVE